MTLLTVFALPAAAQTSDPVIVKETAPATSARTGPEAAQDEGLQVYFPSGVSSLSQQAAAKLDRAARLYRDGNPIVMIVSGNADTVGSAAANLDLSLRRARTVASGLVSRGIPIDRLQVVGRGNSELPVPTENGVANSENRSVSITWR